MLVGGGPASTDDRLVEYVRTHPGCPLGDAAIAAGLDARGRTVHDMCARLGIELRRRPPGQRPGYELYLTGGAR
jgi:hypothetical protein